MKNKKKLLFLIPLLLIILLIFIPQREEDKYKKYYVDSYEPVTVIKVYVFGEVKKTGYYSLNNSSTVRDLLRKCELTDYSSLANLNLNQTLIDGACYEIELIDDNQKNVTVAINVTANIPVIGQVSGNTKININTATEKELITLPGIGTTRATYIINYRKENQFKSVDEIKKVTGISETIYAQIKNYITI